MKKINHDEISVLKRIVLIEKSYYFKNYRALLLLA